MPTFSKRSTIQVPAEALFAWHERAGAFERLAPPWQRVRVVERRGGIRAGARVVLEVGVGPATTRWVVEHRNYVEGRQFEDVQLEGPFARWVHTHRVVPVDDVASALEDSIEYALPLGLLGRAVGGWFARAQLARVFEYRHAVTAADLERHARYAGRAPLRVAVSGSHGMIGSALTDFLTAGGHSVTRLVHSHRAAEGDIPWNPSTGALDGARLEGIDAVVHLAGESAAARWTAERKRRIRSSRVDGAALLANAIATLRDPPKVFVSASASGFYGDRGDEMLDESSARGRGFLADVADAWEAAAEPARGRGVRVVHTRFGLVLSPRGGALEKVLLPFSLGAGGRVGSGRQWWSWVALDDVVGALHFALMEDALRGPVNVVGPTPATNEEFTRTLGRVLGRPTIAAVPAFAVRLAMGEMADEMLLASQRVYPRALERAGFHFRHPTLEKALRFELGRSAG